MSKNRNNTTKIPSNSQKNINPKANKLHLNDRKKTQISKFNLNENPQKVASNYQTDHTKYSSFDRNPKQKIQNPKRKATTLLG